MPIAEPSFADVLSQHMYNKHPISWKTHGAMSVCECGESIYAPIGTTPADAVAQHLADKLMAAGFNPIPEPVLEPKEPDLGPCPHPGKCASVCWGCG
jgi:hypothetical protein